MVLHPQEAEMTLAELRQMATRQQQQIEAQQQLLVSKEQRLKFLKQQESRYNHLTDLKVNPKCLQSLRERVEAQEMKLHQLKALHGQVEQQKTSNSNLGEELESIRALFSEKEKELRIAGSKVEELTRQLDDIRCNKNQRQPQVSPLVIQLENMKRELMYRNKKSDEQNSQITQQRALISQRQQDIIQLDMKIAELTQRLQKKQLMNKHLANQIHNASIARHPITAPSANLYHNANVATVEPMQREPPEPEHTQDDLSAKYRGPHGGDLGEFTLKKNDPKYQTLPYNTKFVMKGKANDDESPTCDDNAWSSSSADNSLERNNNFVKQKNGQAVAGFVHLPPFLSNYNGNRVTRDSQPVDASNDSDVLEKKKPSSLPKFSGSSESRKSENADNVDGNMISSGKAPETPAKPKFLPKTIAETPVGAKIQKEKTFLSKTSSAKPVVPPKPTLPVKPIPPPRQTPTKDRSNSDDKGSIVSMALSVLQNKSSQNDKSTLSNYRERLLYYRCVSSYTLHNSGKNARSAGVPKVSTYFPKHSTSSEIKSLDNSRPKATASQLPIKPKPLTIRKTPGIEPPKLKVPQNYSNGSYKKLQEAAVKPVVVVTAASPAKDDISIERSVSSVPKLNALNSQLSTLSITANSESYEDSEPLDSLESDKVEEEHVKEELAASEFKEFNLDDDDDDDDDSNSSSPCDSLECETIGEGSNRMKTAIIITDKDLGNYLSVKGSLKTEGSVRVPRRVSFDPLALLLDAALEGELELVKKTAQEVPNPSAANDEGITALHNAICAGHYDVVTFLVDFGCDVNAQDSDGWTPLHCAASCNNLPMVKFLVERGACIFATTLSDHETAAEKCEEEEEGFDGCSEYLYGLQENMGLMNDGIVNAVYDYAGLNSDELSFKDGDNITILRNGDDQESEWWWSKLNDEEGYVPRNLLGLFPRISKQD